MPSNLKIELTGLTALRGLAAWWVVFYHFAPFLYAHLPVNIWLISKKGFLAVDLFFILSGFVIFYTYQHSLTANSQSIRNFFVKRLARVYPLHLLILLGYLGFVLVLYFAKGVVPDASSFSLTQFGLQLFLLQAWGFSEGAAFSWNYPAWSISTEFFAYLLFPIMLLWLKPQRWPTLFLVAGIGMTIVALILFYFALGICPGTMVSDQIQVVSTPKICSLNRMIDQTSLLRCALQFFIGVCLCVLYLRSGAQRARWGFISLCLGIACLILGIWLRVNDVYFATLSWALLVFGVAVEPWLVKKILCHRPLVWLGNISYATYLCHALARDVFKLVFVKATGDPSVPFFAPLWTIIFVFIAILVASHLLYRLFERPAQKWVLRRFLDDKPVAAIA
jgi:peptidoglycan/LPS O-acetylase OafA/YrhL